jgi:MFS family permease
MALGTAGFLAASTVSAIVGTRLGGSDRWAGGPGAVYQVGAAAAAYVWGRSFDALGRRATLVLGMCAGALGASIASGAVAAHSLAGFLAGISLMGAAQSALQLGRFVAAEVHEPGERGRAIARVVAGGTVGAVIGPLAVGPAGTLAERLGADVLAGPYGVSAALFVVVAILLAVLLHPDPRALGRRVAGTAGAASAVPPRPLRDVMRDPLARLAVAAMVGGQLVMVTLMVITSVHMAHHAHSLSSIATVISSHVFGMFAFSVVSGRLTDAIGRPRVIALGAAVLAVACALAPLSPRVAPLAFALLLLGLGGNLCYVGGSTLFADRLEPAERGRAQGVNDFVMGGVSAAGSLLSGTVFAAFGYSRLAAVGLAVAAALLAAALWRPRLTPAAAVR